MHDRLRTTAEEAAAAHFHAVQFYDDDAFLHSAVADFLEAGLHASQPAVVIATPLNREAFADRLTARGHDVAALERAGELTMLDASETLASFMVGQFPDPELFRKTVGGVLDRCIGGRIEATVRAYGEMVNVLWRDGNPEGAIRLEELWNELSQTYRFSLLCGYAMGNFYKEGHAAGFHDVCAHHGHVLPAEGYPAAADEQVRLREIATLQQRAKALETELAHRKELEAALRQALADREKAQIDRERLLARERAARAEAESAGRLKDEFLAVLSHELRTPLNAILGWTHIAIDPATDEPTVRRALDVIQRNAKLQLHVTDDLLDVSRILTGKMLVASDPLDLSEVLSSALDTVRPAASAKNIDLALHIDNSARLVVGDRDRLQQILWNLLSNAIKFTPGGGRVELRLERRDASAEIVVRDNGQGIAAEFLPHVFERFRQADTGTTRRHGGLGLGLAVVRYLVEAHGGTVHAESDGIGTGASFIVSLPMQSGTTLADDGIAQPAAALEGARILVVDDDLDARELFAYILGGAGAEIHTAGTVSDALRLLSSGSFNVLVGDIGLPDRDGYGMIEAIRTHPSAKVRAIRAIAVTSYAGDHYRARAIGAGYDEYIAKPVEPARLTQVVADLIRKPQRTIPRN
jgi:signal transduction histidine kinase/ActR/RegA family two-component response regulator